MPKEGFIDMIENRYRRKHAVRTLLLSAATAAMLLCSVNAAAEPMKSHNDTAEALVDTPAEAFVDTPQATEIEGDTATIAAENATEQAAERPGPVKILKTKFIEGNAAFMSIVALVLVLGLSFCIERIAYLTLSDVNARRLLQKVDALVADSDVAGARALCRDTRGPVASICYQALLRIDDDIATIERSVQSYGSVQTAALERGCSWIKLFIAMAPSLGFLGTVIGIVMAFGEMQAAGDISPTIVASGMKVALITTIFGIIVALILQLFYNYITSRIDTIASEMEESAVALLDIISRFKHGKA